MAVRIYISKNQVRAKVEKAWNQAVPDLAQEVLNDCNQYCKEKSGELIASSYSQSDEGKGKLIWRTPYARRQYWLITANKDVNPRASWKWCEVAKRNHGKKWTAMAQRALRSSL